MCFCMCVFVCVCERERERERETQTPKVERRAHFLKNEKQTSNDIIAGNGRERFMILT